MFHSPISRHHRLRDIRSPEGGTRKEDYAVRSNERGIHPVRGFDSYLVCVRWRGWWGWQFSSGVPCPDGGYFNGEYPFRGFRPHQRIREPERVGDHRLVRVWNRFVVGTFIKTADQALAADTVPQAINATLPSLSPGTKYYFRVAATNSVGTLKGTIENLTTTLPPPTVHTSTADPAAGSAVVNGTVNPNGLATTAWFEYGNDPSLANPTKTDNQVLPAGISPVSITATLSTLNTTTLYYYRVAAQSAGGLSNGGSTPFSLPRPLRPSSTRGRINRS